MLKPGAYATDLQAASAGNSPDGLQLAKLYELQGDLSRSIWDGLALADRRLNNPRPGFQAAYAGKLATPWCEMALAHTQVIVAEQAMASGTSPTAGVVAFGKQHDVVNELYRWLVDSTPNGWALPVLYTVCRDLKRLAVIADLELVRKGQKPTRLEQASRLLQKCFSACLNDRTSDHALSRKMGTYYMAVLLFKTYFKLKSTALSKNLIKGIGAAELPSFTKFPKAHRVAFNYYLGVFAFLREDYTEAESKFSASLQMMHQKARRNIDLIYDYLIPLMLYRGVLPSPKVLQASRHSEVFGPFVEAWETGNIAQYDEQLKAAQKRLMERGTYLLVERAREGAVRALLKRAWIFDSKPSRMPIATFVKVYNAAVRMPVHVHVPGTNTEAIDSEEMECLLANMIYKGRIKGYIAHSQQVVVLSKDQPFPWYPPVAPQGAVAKAAREAREKGERLRLPALNTPADVMDVGA